MGEAPYFSVEIASTVRSQDLLAHLAVLIPVLDNEKHYWVGEDENGKLLSLGEGWLGQHPEKDLIVSRYLKRQRKLTREALDRLAEEEPGAEDEQEEVRDEEEQKVERLLGLHEQRMGTVLSVLRGAGRRGLWTSDAADASCCDTFSGIRSSSRFWDGSVVAVDGDRRERLKLDQLPERQRTRLQFRNKDSPNRQNHFTFYRQAGAKK